MAGLLDEMQANVRKPGGVCTVRGIREKLDKEDQKDLEKALKDLPAPAIAAALSSRGMKVSAYTIQRHRRGLCTCE